MTRRQRQHDRLVKDIAARAVGLSYGPSECRGEDAEEFRTVKTGFLSVSAAPIPVCYVYTRNRGILETVSA